MQLNNITSFIKTHNFLICIDSDGCAMDTMTYKHEMAFCPMLIEVYKLQKHERLITDYWLNINLYSAHRGVNRFKGLAMTLLMLRESKIETNGLSELLAFVENADSLSGANLKKAIENGGGEGLSTALLWSERVNAVIEGLAANAKPFEGCKKTIELLHKSADIAVVSSANGAAIESEWSEHGITPYTDIRLGQEAGSKASCIKALLQKGYIANNVLMVGDALGDLSAAKQNEVLFYPILVKDEVASWQALKSKVAQQFFDNSYKGNIENSYIEKQKSILSF